LDLVKLTGRMTDKLIDYLTGKYSTIWLGQFYI
jgi:hypothetical protein